MFTLEQIKARHAKVKSGTDFPQYVQDMKGLGVTSYEHYVADGHTQYYGGNDFMISGNPKWEAREIAPSGNANALKSSLKIHQKGGTDYPTFCKESAEAGVEKWTVDMIKMTCTYYDKEGDEMLVETIPTV